MRNRGALQCCSRYLPSLQCRTTRQPKRPDLSSPCPGRCDRALEDLLGKMISYVRIIWGGGAALQTKFCSTRAGGTRAVLAPVQRCHWIWLLIDQNYEVSGQSPVLPKLGVRQLGRAGFIIKLLFVLQLQTNIETRPGHETVFSTRLCFYI